MKAREIYKITYTSGETTFVHALSIEEAKMKAYDQSGEEFDRMGLPTEIEAADLEEVQDLEWYRFQMWRDEEYA